MQGTAAGQHHWAQHCAIWGQLPYHPHHRKALAFILPGMTVDYLGRVRPLPRGEFEIQDAINQMIAAGLTAGGLVQATPRE